MNHAPIHHVSVAVEDLQRARQFYTDVLEMKEIDRPAFDHPGIWYKIGDGLQQLHIIVNSEATIRRDKFIDLKDVHFALRVKSYRNMVKWLRDKGFRDDAPDYDLQKMRLRPDSIAGFPQVYILDPDHNIIEFNCETLD
jgi:glyoxylase I family protein